MELDAPIRERDQSYTVPIRCLQPYMFTYTTESIEQNGHSYPTTDCSNYKELCNVIAIEYEKYSLKWFGTKTMPIMFLGRLSHSWDVGKHVPAERSYTGPVRQSWCPDHIKLLPNTNRIHWKLYSADYRLEENDVKPSGPDEHDTSRIPFEPVREIITINSTPRSRAIRKVRMARLYAAISAERVARLTKRFYERYGSVDALEGDDVLSSESEDEKESNALRIKI
jgi:hypothetical protein